MVGREAWKLLLLGASLLSAHEATQEPDQEASTQCAEPASAQTQPVRGPGGVAAVLKVSSGDDHSKDLHDCLAEYQLLVLPARGGSAASVPLQSSDGEWGRKLSLRLDGFSLDGKRVFGRLAEGGRTPGTWLFDYHATDGKVQLIDVSKALGQLRSARCGESVAVAGTTGTGEIVLGPDPPSQCGIRWTIDPATARLRRLPQGTAVTPLFTAR